MIVFLADNRIEQVVVSTFLRKRGIRCSVAANGQEAVDKWRTGGFHLVLVSSFIPFMYERALPCVQMDIQLPVKSGIEATMEIRELEKANNIAAFQMTPTAEGPPPSARSQSSTSSQSSAVEDSKLGNELKLTAIPSPVTTPAHQLPVIIVALTASSLSADRISALAAGCNDFITKPVNHKWLHQKVLEWGSMSYLSSFRRLKTPSTAPVSPVTRTGLTFDRVAAQHKAQEIAAGLYIERKPKEVNSNREDPPPGASASV